MLAVSLCSEMICLYSFWDLRYDGYFKTTQNDDWGQWRGPKYWERCLMTSLKGKTFLFVLHILKLVELIKIHIMKVLHWNLRIELKLNPFRSALSSIDFTFKSKHIHPHKPHVQTNCCHTSRHPQSSKLSNFSGWPFICGKRWK